MNVPPKQDHLTLLQICIEALSDRLDLCIATDCKYILLFYQELFNKCHGKLNLNSTVRIFRSLAYFMNNQCTNLEWMEHGYNAPNTSYEFATPTDTNEVNDANSSVLFGSGPLNTSHNSVDSANFLDSPSRSPTKDSMLSKMKKYNPILKSAEVQEKIRNMVLSRAPSSISASRVLVRFVECFSKPIDRIMETLLKERRERVLNTKDIIVEDASIDFLHRLPEEVFSSNGNIVSQSNENDNETTAFIQSIVFDLVNQSTDNVEISRILETTQKIIARPTSTIASVQFWNQIHTVGKMLFLDEHTHCQSLFMTLCGLCKLAWLSLRTVDTSENRRSYSNNSDSTDRGSSVLRDLEAHKSPLQRQLSAENTNAEYRDVTRSSITNLSHSSLISNVSPRDLGMKVLVLESINQFLIRTASQGEHLQASKLIGYQIRRLVIPCILHNVQFALRDHRVFSKLLQIVTTLWKLWRMHVRMEFAVLVESVILRFIQVDTTSLSNDLGMAHISVVRPIVQMLAVQEVRKCCPHSMMFSKMLFLKPLPLCMAW